LTLDGLTSYLKMLLPSTFDELNHPFAVGVCNESKQFSLVDKGEDD
jgi:hypothetical protein